jgi:alkyl hydroperoxide reductase subunit AhpC
MTIRINDTVPDFTANTTHGLLRFHEWIGDYWAIFFSHPKDFTPICTTEIGLMAKIEKEFVDRETKIIAHSIDPVQEHFKWFADIEKLYGVRPSFPIIGDENLEVAKLLEMLPAEAIPGVRTAADNATVRSVFIIGPDKKIKLMASYPMTVGRNFDEVIRTLDALQLNAQFKLVTPVNWKMGDSLVIPPAISNEQAKELFPKGWVSETPYLRVIDAATIGAK